MNNEQQVVETNAEPSIADMSLADYRAQREGKAAAAPKVEEDKAEEPTAGADGAGENAAPGDADENTEQAGEKEPANDERAAREGSKKAGGFQRKISKLQEENEQLKRQLADASAARPQANSDQPSAKGSEPQADSSELKADSFSKAKPKLEDFDSIETFTEALTDWKLEKQTFERNHADAQAKAQAEGQKVLDTWNSRQAEAKKTHTDYDEVLAEVDDVKLSPAHQRIFLESERGPELAYKLAQDRDELEKFAAMPPLQAARYLGKLEAQLSGATPKTETQVSQAPKPVRPLGAKSAAAGTVDVSKLSLAEYRRAREAGKVR